MYTIALWTPRKVAFSSPLRCETLHLHATGLPLRNPPSTSKSSTPLVYAALRHTIFTCLLPFLSARA